MMSEMIERDEKELYWENISEGTSVDEDERCDVTESE